MENGTKFHGSNVIVLLNFKLHNWQTVHTTILDLMHFKLRKLENFQFSICLCGPAECAERLNIRWIVANNPNQWQEHIYRSILSSQASRGSLACQILKTSDEQTRDEAEIRYHALRFGLGQLRWFGSLPTRDVRHCIAAMQCQMCEVRSKNLRQLESMAVAVRILIIRSRSLVTIALCFVL